MLNHIDTLIYSPMRLRSHRHCADNADMLDVSGHPIGPIGSRGDCRRPGDAAARGLARTRLQHGRGSQGDHLGPGAAKRPIQQGCGVLKNGGIRKTDIPKFPKIAGDSQISIDTPKKCRIDGEDDDNPC